MPGYTEMQVDSYWPASMSQCKVSHKMDVNLPVTDRHFTGKPVRLYYFITLQTL